LDKEMKVFGVIPARYGSTRFPGKPLVSIAGKPLLQWVVEGARSAKRIDEILVATDDSRIAELAKQLGVRVIMTDPNLPSGSDRVWAAVEKENCDLVLNIQGDEPLIQGEPLDQLIRCFDSAPHIEMATLGRQMTTI
jgi:3-deoxy-manno-octulosonate cytidylyltransferase (CMP-KDO synthetase)